MMDWLTDIWDGVTGDWWSDSSDSGGIPDGWHSIDSVATSSDDYSSLFDLSFDDSWLGTAWDVAGSVGTGTVGLLSSAMNSPSVMGMIGGAAEGYNNQQLLEIEEEKLKMLQEEVARKNALKDKHNASLQTPHEDITKRIRRI